MRFSTSIIGAIFAACASANSIVFNNLDSIPKTIYFTGNDNMGGSPATIQLAANSQVTWSTSAPWIGNFYSINQGAANIPGMLGEVNFADAGVVWYDVSAIVDATDNDGVKQLWATAADPISGCTDYSSRCANAYNLPDDIQTKSTASRTLYCSVGKASGSKVKMARDHARDFMAKLREMAHAV